MNSIDDQEKIDAIKAWFREYGMYVVTILALGIFGSGGVFFWFDFQNDRSHEAADKMYDVSDAIKAGDISVARNKFLVLTEEYPNSFHTALASIRMAKLEHRQGNPERAVELLEIAIDGDISENLKILIKLRLAELMLDQKSFGRASEVLNGLEEFPAYASIVSDLKGDLYHSQGKISEAEASLSKALNAMVVKDSWKAIIEMKQDSIESLK